MGSSVLGNSRSRSSMRNKNWSGHRCGGGGVRSSSEKVQFLALHIIVGRRNTGSNSDGGGCGTSTNIKTMVIVLPTV